jgi:hypothetical protein
MIKTADTTFEDDDFDVLHETSLALTRKNGSFSIADVFTALENEPFFDHDLLSLEDELLNDPDIGVLPGKKELRFFSLEAFFEGAEFLVKPTEFEVENLVFFIGHRLMPFFPEEDACIMKFFEKKGNKALHRKRIELPFHELDMCYSLYPPEAGVFTAIENFDIDEFLEGETPPIVTAGGLDLGPFISENGFVFGDYIKVCLKDYHAGQCEIEHVPLSKLSSDPKTAKWKGKFEAGLKKAVKRQKEDGGLFSNDDLIGAAFYYSGKQLLKNPPCSWLEAVKSSDKFALQIFEGRLFVWEKDGLKDYMDKALALEEKAEFYDDGYIEDDLTEMMGEFNLNEEIIIAYMLDAIHFNKTLEDVKRHCFDDIVEDEYPEMLDELDELLPYLWKAAEETNPEVRTVESVKLRHDLLKIKDRELAFLKALKKSGLDILDLDSESFFKLDNLSFTLEDFILQVGVQPFESNDEFKMVEKMVEEMADRFECVIEELEEEYLNF